MKNKMLTSTPHCLPEIDAQKKKIADRLTVLAGTMFSNSHFGWERGLCKGATD
jgi:hypothetical protein